jgi:hypothetical protein
MGVADGRDETNTVRLSTRTSPSNFHKLVMIAKDRGWLNSRGHPNVSRVLNFVIDQFDYKRPKAKTKAKEVKRAKRR